MRVVIAGKGAWGNALYLVLSQNTKEVFFWDKETLIQKTDILVLAVPTEAIRQVLKFVNDDVIIVNSTKGIEQETRMLPFQIVFDVLKKNNHYFSLIGPGFAREVIQKMPTLVNIGFRKDTYLDKIKKLFTADYFRLQPTQSIEAIELAGAFKNIYAIASGLSEGLGFGANTRAFIITRAAEEIYLLSKGLGFSIEENAMPAVLGDLILSCNSSQSRNFLFGKLLSDIKVREALKIVNATVEGYNSVSSIAYFAKKSGKALPLASFVAATVKDNKNIKDRFCEFTRLV